MEEKKEKQGQRKEHSGLYEELSTPRWLLASFLGAILSWLIILVANSPILHSGARALQSGKLSSPDPRTCLPGKCWDGADKYGYPLCTSWHQISGPVRGVRVDRTSYKTCYKAMYINFEMTAAYCFALIMFWGIATSRMLERLLHACWDADCRFLVAAAVLLDMPAWYYSIKVSFVYVNEFMHDMQRSQTFFTVTEFFVLVVLTAHVRKSDALRPGLLTSALATSLFHISQIMSMEYWNFFAGNYKQARNYVLILGDLSTCTATLQLLSANRGGTRGDARWTLLRAVAFSAVISLVFRFTSFDVGSVDSLDRLSLVNNITI